MAKTINLNQYFCQWDNKLDPGGTCNVTSIAMALYYLGIRGDGSAGLPDQLHERCDRLGLDRHSPDDLKKLVESFDGYHDNYTSTGTLDDIKKSIDAGVPCVIHGWFTGSGHIILIKGYTDSGQFIVMDPAGEWFPNGYDDYASGKNNFYSDRLILSAAIGNSHEDALNLYDQWANGIPVADRQRQEIWLHRIYKAI